MHCPVCQNQDTKVIDSRTASENSIRRRRECEKCGFRFSTYEQIEVGNIDVQKKDGRREPYSREKMERGVKKALEKRPVTEANYNRFIIQVEEEIMRRATGSVQSGTCEIPSQVIGEIIMQHLKELDQVAYIRFASVYRSFEDVESFKAQIDELEKVKTP